MLMEKLQAFAEGKYDITNVPGAQITADYENKRSDAWERIEALGVTSRMVSTGASSHWTMSRSGFH
jgi:amphiphysin